MLQHNNKIDPRHFHEDPDNKNKFNNAAPDPTCSSSVRILINLMDPDPCLKKLGFRSVYGFVSVRS